MSADATTPSPLAAGPPVLRASALGWLVLAVVCPTVGGLYVAAQSSVSETLPLFLLVPPALVAAALCIRYPLAALYGVLVWVPLQYWVTSEFRFIPQKAVLLDEALLGLATVAWVVRAFEPGKRVDVCLRVLLPTVLFLAVGLTSMVLNDAPVFPALFGIRQHLQYALAFFAVVNLSVGEAHLRRMIWITLAIAFVQVPVMLYQWATAGSRFVEEGANAPDLLVGTMGSGGGNTLGYFLLLAIGVLLGWYRVRQGSRAKLAVGAAILLVAFVLCGSRISLPIFALFLVWLFLPVVVRGMGSLAPIVVLAVLVAGGVYYYTQHVLTDSENILSLELNLHSESDPTNVGRIAYYPIGWDVLHEHAWSPWVGTGPATFFSMAGRRFRPPLSIAYNYRIKSEVVSSGIIGTGVEYGYLGLAAFYGVMVAFYLLARRVWRRTDDPYWEGIARGYVVGLMLFAITPLVMNTWEVQYFAVYVWTIPAMLHVHGRSLGERRARENEEPGVGR